MKCKDCFMYSICNGTCDWDNKPVDANDSADDCPNFDYTRMILNDEVTINEIFLCFYSISYLDFSR